MARDSYTGVAGAARQESRSIIEQTGFQPDQLTIFAVPDWESTDDSAWITVSEDSFVYLSLMR
jgi:hypothetical protein